MKTLFAILLYSHVALAFVALASGSIAMFTRKGSTLHKKAGLLFYITMVTSLPLAIVITLLPDHSSPFLLSIGIFSLYFTIAGKRSLKYNQDDINLFMDKIMASLLFLTGCLMVFYPILIQGVINIILCVFGLLSIFFGIQDWHLFLHPSKRKKQFLRDHIAKMSGAYIAAVSAFLVNMEYFPSLINWFAPGVLGGIYIYYYMRKYKIKET